ncbi:hypothetical protein ACQJ5Z_05015 [Helicobacter pylori]|uniref:hypothetical protein n=1 Tax=Helicobacter pylori TaxID=210 RepID=UPI0012E8FA50|nr:hypothetical protein [Helicobacter pylori]MUU49420.1 hypothetical protein [Helicobacter pylori]
MDKNRDDHAIMAAIMANVIKSLERCGSFSPIDRAKFVQFAKMHGIEYSVIEEVIDITQTISLIHLHEDRLDASNLPREEKKAMCTELQKSIDENLKALKSIRHGILMRDMRDLLPMSMRFFDHVFKVQEILNNKK